MRPMYTTDNDRKCEDPSMGPESFRDIWEEIIAAGATMHTFCGDRPVSRGNDRWSSRVSRRGCIPLLFRLFPGHSFVSSLTLPGKALAVYLVVASPESLRSVQTVSLSSMCLGATWADSGSKRWCAGRTRNGGACHRRRVSTGKILRSLTLEPEAVNAAPG